MSARRQASANDLDQITMFRVLLVSRAVRASSSAPGLGLGAGYDIPVLRMGSAGFGDAGVPHGLPGRGHWQGSPLTTIEEHWYTT